MRALVQHSPQPVTRPILRLPFPEFSRYTLPLRDEAETGLFPDPKYYYKIPVTSSAANATTNLRLALLFRCLHSPNPHTNHLRVPFIIQNVSQVPSTLAADGRSRFNPTIVSLPSWSSNQYLLVSRVVTEGLHQENLLCEANTCYAGAAEGRRPGEADCSKEDLAVLGTAGGLRCAHGPILLSVPPTPSEQCDGQWQSFADLPGFHDPRIFWSGKGEPLMIMNSQYVASARQITPFLHSHQAHKSAVPATLASASG